MPGFESPGWLLIPDFSDVDSGRQKEWLKSLGSYCPCRWQTEFLVLAHHFISAGIASLVFDFGAEHWDPQKLPPEGQKELVEKSPITNPGPKAHLPLPAALAAFLEPQASPLCSEESLVHTLLRCSDPVAVMSRLSHGNWLTGAGPGLLHGTGRTRGERAVQWGALEPGRHQQRWDPFPLSLCPELPVGGARMHSQVPWHCDEPCDWMGFGHMLSWGPWNVLTG